MLQYSLAMHRTGFYVRSETNLAVAGRVRQVVVEWWLFHRGGGGDFAGHLIQVVAMTYLTVCKCYPVIILGSVISSVLVLSARYIEQKVIWRACTTMKTIPDSRNWFFRKFQGTQIPGPNQFSAGVRSKWHFLPIFPSVTRTFSHLSSKLDLGLKFQVSGREAYLCD